MEEQQQRIREENAIVLDFLPNGYPFDKSPAHRKTPIVQAIGVEHFTLLELVPKKDIHINSHDKVYIGKGKRDHIHHINGRIPLSKLTQTAAGELPFVVKQMLIDDEKRFVDFFNNARPLSMRMHQLELLPGLGKKHMWEVLEERKVKPFESFADIKERVKLIPDVHKLFFNRIMKELEGLDKHKLFVE